MRRSILFLLWLISTTASWAQAPSPAQMGITRSAVPEVLQVLDHNQNWVTLGPVANGVYTPQFTVGPLSVTSVGMQTAAQGCTTDGSGQPCFDNSPLLPALLAANGQPLYTPPSVPSGFIGQGVPGVGAWFPANQGGPSVEYYFTRKISWSRTGKITCGGYQSWQNVALVFAPGIDGIDIEDHRMSSDGGYGLGTRVEGCNLVSMGEGYGWFDPNDSSGGATVYGGNFGTGVIDETAPPHMDGWGAIPATKWEVGDGIIAAPYNWGGGQNMIINGSLLNVDYGTTVTAVDSVGRLTLSSPAHRVGGLVAADGAMILFRLPVELAYTATTKAGNSHVTLSGGPNILWQPGDHVWSRQFPLGATVWDAYNQTPVTAQSAWGPAAPPTSSGAPTLTTVQLSVPCPAFPWGDSATVPFYAAPPTDASGNALGYAYSCPAGSSTLTLGNAPTGSSGNAGDTILLPVYSTSLPLAQAAGHQLLNLVGAYMTTTVGTAHLAAADSTGPMWRIPHGIGRRVTSSTAHVQFNHWPFALNFASSNGSIPSTLSDGSRDSSDQFVGANLIGRFVAGNESGGSMSDGNIYGGNHISDIIELGSVSEAYFADNPNTGENGQSGWGTMGQCNFGGGGSIYVGMYASNEGGVRPYCMSTTGAIDAPPYPPVFYSTSLWIGTFAGLPVDVSSLALGSYRGNFAVTGPPLLTEATAAAAPGATTVTVDASSLILPQVPTNVATTTIKDQTTTDAIPTGTYVTAISGQTMTLSNPVGGTTGVQNGDILLINGQSCARLAGGLSTLTGISFGKTGCGDGTSWGMHWSQPWTASGFFNSTQPTPALGLISTDFAGYKGNTTYAPLAPVGLLLTNNTNLVPGSERLLDEGTAIPTGASTVLRGNYRLNASSSPGGNGGWAATAQFQLTLTAPVNVGDTSAQVATCPTATIPTAVAINSTAFLPPKFLAATGGSCIGNVLSFQAPAVGASNGATDPINIVQWKPFALISNDFSGTSYNIGAATTIASLPLCNDGLHTGATATVTNGIASPTYLQTVGTLGTSSRPVFCDGTNWLYH